MKMRRKIDLGFKCSILDTNLPALFRREQAGAQEHQLPDKKWCSISNVFDRTMRSTGLSEYDRSSHQTEYST